MLKRLQTLRPDLLTGYYVHTNNRLKQEKLVPWMFERWDKSLSSSDVTSGCLKKQLKATQEVH